MPKPTSTALVLDSQPLSIGEVVAVAREGRPVALGQGAREKIAAARAVIEGTLNDGLPHYGINTGFGSLSKQRINAGELRDLQRNLIRSHAAGVGEPLPDDVVRGMMLLLAASLARGHSGVRVEVVELICGMLNAGVVPVVPAVGSVGASGDLAPLAHVALALIGEGAAKSNSQTTDAAAALARAGLSPVTLEAKEGLALINGTHLMASRGALCCHDACVLWRAAVAACAMSIDASRATDAFLDPRIHNVRRQPGQQAVAAALTGLLSGSQILTSHLENDPRVQDPYCLRCAPQVLGAAHDAIVYATGCIERELGAVTDNPLVFAEGGPHGPILSGGNFHGMPLAIPLDALAIAVSHIAGISERRTFWMLSAFEPEAHLNPYLAAGRPGLNSGLMIAQYTAAACCNEIITLCTPASVSNIGTSAGIEDYNSFGPRSAAKAERAVELARYVVAIELLSAAEAIERHRPLRSGRGVESVHQAIRARVPVLTADRPPATDTEVIASMIRSGIFEPTVLNVLAHA